MQVCRQKGDSEKPQAGHGTALLNLALHQRHMMLSHMHVRNASMLQLSANSKVDSQMRKAAISMILSCCCNVFLMLPSYDL